MTPGWVGRAPFVAGQRGWHFDLLRRRVKDCGVGPDCDVVRHGVGPCVLPPAGEAMT